MTLVAFLLSTLLPEWVAAAGDAQHRLRVLMLFDEGPRLIAVDVVEEADRSVDQVLQQLEAPPGSAQQTVVDLVTNGVPFGP